MRSEGFSPRIQLGRGSQPRDGFYNIDLLENESADLTLDYEREPLPFVDESIDEIYCSLVLNYLKSPVFLFRELQRVAKHKAQMEVWLPHPRSDVSSIIGAPQLFSELQWKHIVYEHDDFYFKPKTFGRLHWIKSSYVLYPGIAEELSTQSISLEFALTHYNNVAIEYGVLLEFDRTICKARFPQYPAIEYFEGSRNEKR